MTQKENLQLQTLTFLKKIFYEKNKEFCDKIPAVKIIFKELFLKMDKLDKIRIKGGRGEAFREIKLDARKTLCETAVITASGLFAFANLTKNKVLRNAVNYCYSDFFRSEETEMLNRCKMILRTAKRTKGLAYVDFDENLTVDLQNHIFRYEKLCLEKNGSKSDTMKYNYLISKLINECMCLLKNKLNPLMKMLSKKYPDAYRNYQSSIQVRKQAGRKKKRNKKQQSNTKTRIAKPNILHQKSSENIMHRFAELATAE
jgi:hypothetical protein